MALHPEDASAYAAMAGATIASVVDSDGEHDVGYGREITSDRARFIDYFDWGVNELALWLGHRRVQMHGRAP